MLREENGEREKHDRKSIEKREEDVQRGVQAANGTLVSEWKAARRYHPRIRTDGVVIRQMGSQSAKNWINESGGPEERRRKRTGTTAQGKPPSAHGERYPKTSSADIRTKIRVIESNAHRYPISALCQCLEVARSLYYYHQNRPQGPKDMALSERIIEIFQQNRQVYGCRKIKAVLQREGKTVSKRRICRIMKEKQLEAAYRRRKPRKSAEKEKTAEASNILNRQFDNQPAYHTVVSDLTYVRVGSAWYYVCVLVDLHNREIIGHSVGPHHDAQLVQAAFARVTIPLNRIRLFHTDRGSEFDNQLIDETLTTFKIQRSLSAKACPYDNSVAEATFRMIKEEFIWKRTFNTLDQLRLELDDFIHWFNYLRLHSSLGYRSPIEYRRDMEKVKPEKEQ